MAIELTGKPKKVNILHETNKQNSYFKKQKGIFLMVRIPYLFHDFSFITKISKGYFSLHTIS